MTEKYSSQMRFNIVSAEFYVTYFSTFSLAGHISVEECPNCPQPLFLLSVILQGNLSTSLILHDIHNTINPKSFSP